MLSKALDRDLVAGPSKNELDDLGKYSFTVSL
jgi:hypothetical protein